MPNRFGGYPAFDKIHSDFMLDVAKVIEYRRLDKHEILCAEGDLPDYYYVIVSGRFAVAHGLDLERVGIVDQPVELVETAPVRTPELSRSHHKRGSIFSSPSPHLRGHSRTSVSDGLASIADMRTLLSVEDVARRLELLSADRIEIWRPDLLAAEGPSLADAHAELDEKRAFRTERAKPKTIVLDSIDRTLKRMIDRTRQQSAEAGLSLSWLIGDLRQRHDALHELLKRLTKDNGIKPTVSRLELGAGLLELGGLSVSPAQLERVLGTLDVDGSGLLDRETIAALLTKYDVKVHGPLFRAELMTAQELSDKWKWQVMDLSQICAGSENSKVIVELHTPGTGMGQRALASNSLRTASIVTVEESEVLLVNKDAYMRFLTTAEEAEAMKGIAWLRTLDIMKPIMDHNLLVKFYYILKRRHCSPSEPIYAQGLVLKPDDDGIVLIRSGQCRLLRTLEASISEHKTASFRKLQKRGFKMDVELGLINDGEIIGGETVLLNQPHKHCRAIAVTHVELYVLAKSEIRHLLHSGKQVEALLAEWARVCTVRDEWMRSRSAVAIADIAPHKFGRFVQDELTVQKEDRRQLRMCAAAARDCAAAAGLRLYDKSPYGRVLAPCYCPSPSRARSTVAWRWPPHPVVVVIRRVPVLAAVQLAVRDGWSARVIPSQPIRPVGFGHCAFAASPITYRRAPRCTRREAHPSTSHRSATLGSQQPPAAPE